MQKIHHDDDADARHYWRIEASSSPAIGPRAATTAPRPRSGCCGRTASSANAATTTASVPRRQRQFFSGAVAIAIMHLSTLRSSRGKRLLLLLAHPSIITASAVARPLSSSSEHHQIV